MSFKHAWDPKSKQTPEQIEKRLTAERDASRQLARQLEWRLLALERTLTAEQRTQLASMTGWQHLESSRNVAIYIKNDVNSNTYGMRAVYVAAVAPLDVLPIITDVKTFGQWDWAIASTDVLERDDAANHCVVHCRYKHTTSKRLATRDYVYSLSWDQCNDEINVHLRSCVHGKAPAGAGGFERGEIVSGGWRVARVAASEREAGSSGALSVLTFTLFYDPKGNEDRAFIERLHELIAVQNGHNLIKLEKHAMHERQRSLKANNKHRTRISHDTPLSGADTSSLTTRPRRRSISDGRTRFEYARLVVDESNLAVDDVDVRDRDKPDATK